MEDETSGSEIGEEQEQILYDIVTYKEWEQDPEVVKKNDPVRSLGWLGTASPGHLPPTVERIQGASLPWHIAVSKDGSFIAVLQELWLEVWSSREQYNTLIGRRPVERDPAPQWRKLQWTDDASLLAVAQSNGSVELCDTVGGSVYNIISPGIPASQPGWADTPRIGPSNNSYCGMFFASARLREKKWTSELLLVEFSGKISSFLVSHSGYQELSSYTIGWSLTSATFCHAHSLLITAGGGTCPLTGKRRLIGRASYQGILALRDRKSVV